MYLQLGVKWNTAVNKMERSEIKRGSGTAPDGGCLDVSGPSPLKTGTWYQIVKLKDNLQNLRINLPIVFKKNIDNGISSRFWEDYWVAIDTWKKVLNSWNLDFMCLSSLTDVMYLADNVRIQAPLIKYFDVVIHTTILASLAVSK
ncbi:hypothetical protein Tco_0898893 [Tanacetum coccineum]